jgi:hypothetical protein
LDDPRLAKLRELLDQATKLLDGANELVSDLTEQLERSTGKMKDDQSSTLKPPLSGRPR